MPETNSGGKIISITQIYEKTWKELELLIYTYEKDHFL